MMSTANNFDHTIADASILVASPTSNTSAHEEETKPTTTKVNNSWANNVTVRPKKAPTKSFADIVAEQENATVKEKEEKARSEAEEKEVMLAIQASIENTSINNDTPAEDDMDPEIRQAIALSMQENGTTSSSPEEAVAGLGVASSTDNACLSANEVEEIERALREADEAEAVKSYELAVQLQQENSSRLKTPHDQQQGHVRTITREEFMLQQSGLGSPQAPPGGYVDHHREEPSSDMAGFRMNTSKPETQSWQRLDRATIVGPNNELRTKHDIELQGQANAQRLGLDAEAYDDKFAHVGNKAFNSFKQTMKRGTKKGVATHGTGRATADTDKTRQGGMDSNVRLQISSAINNGVIEDCNGIVKEGKEAVVYHAKGGSESGGYDVAIKVFKRIQEFKQRGQYVDGDPRFLGNKFSNESSRKQVEIWTEKEYRNLIRAQRSNVPVPTPLLYKDNILFMRFLGDGWPAPQLREVEIKKGSKKWTTLYDQTMISIRCLYNKAKLVHADLSEYNILVCPTRLVENRFDDIGLDDSAAVQIVLIDFGQAVDVRHPNADEFLKRDLFRIQEFYKHKGVKTMNAKESKEYVLTWDETDDIDYVEDDVVEDGVLKVE